MHAKEPSKTEVRTLVEELGLNHRECTNMVVSPVNEKRITV
jgi:hypothetical protein